MKSSRMKITAVLLAAAFTLTGCSEALYVMTPEEESTVISYASHVVAKYNTYQQDGEIFVRQDILNSEEETQEKPVADTQETIQETEEASEQNAEAAPQNSSDSQEAAEHTADISQALGLGAVKAEFTEYNLCTTYEKSDVFAVDAETGKQLLVLNVNLTNPTEQDIPIDILTMSPTFRAVFNETDSAMAQTTILPNDLSTYQGDLLAGTSAEAVLLFQIPQEIEEVSDIQLIITANGNRYTVNF